MPELAGAEPANFEALRKEWIKKQLKAREAQFTNTFNIKYVLLPSHLSLTSLFFCCVRSLLAPVSILPSFSTRPTCME